MEKKLERALEIMENLDWDTVECGRYEVDDDIYYMVQEYETNIHMRLVMKRMKNM